VPDAPIEPRWPAPAQPFRRQRLLGRIEGQPERPLVRPPRLAGPTQIPRQLCPDGVEERTAFGVSPAGDGRIPCGRVAAMPGL
jgi:hypothetical protein